MCRLCGCVYSWWRLILVLVRLIWVGGSWLLVGWWFWRCSWVWWRAGCYCCWFGAGCFVSWILGCVCWWFLLWWYGFLWFWWYVWFLLFWVRWCIICCVFCVVIGFLFVLVGRCWYLCVGLWRFVWCYGWLVVVVGFYWSVGWWLVLWWYWVFWCRWFGSVFCYRYWFCGWCRVVVVGCCIVLVIWRYWWGNVGWRICWNVYLLWYWRYWLGECGYLVVVIWRCVFGCGWCVDWGCVWLGFWFCCWFFLYWIGVFWWCGYCWRLVGCWVVVAWWCWRSGD